jgi:Tfp pilus assembly protein PilF
LYSVVVHVAILFFESLILLFASTSSSLPVNPTHSASAHHPTQAFDNAVAFEKKKDFQSAADAYLKVIALNPKLAGAHNNLGHVTVRSLWSCSFV